MIPTYRLLRVAILLVLHNGVHPQLQLVLLGLRQRPHQLELALQVATADFLCDGGEEEGTGDEGEVAAFLEVLLEELILFKLNLSLVSHYYYDSK